MAASTAPESVGILGVGLLGSAMAARLIERGFRVTGFDLERDANEALKALGGTALASAAAVFRDCRRVLLCLPHSDHVRTLVDEVSGELLSNHHAIIDTTTGCPAATARLGMELEGRGVVYVDATVSGSSAMARRGEVTVTAGGCAAALAQVDDLLHALASTVLHVGPVGSGAKMKLVTNLALGLNRAAAAEALGFASALGIKPETALEALKASGARSQQLEAKGVKMVQRDFTPQARLSQHLKDVGLILAAAEEAGLELPLSAAHRALLEHLEAAGFGAEDNSAVRRFYDPRP